MRARRKQDGWWAALLLFPALILLAALLALPLAWIVRVSFNEAVSGAGMASSWTLANYSHFLGDLWYLKNVLLWTIWISVGATAITVVISYPLAVNAVRLIKATNGKEFTRAELVALIDETYREIYRQEAETQSSPTPPVSERGQIVNRPVSDGTFGISMHDLDDLGIAGIDVYRIDGLVWLDPVMES